MLKMTDAKLDLVSSIAMFQFIKNVMRREISYIVQTHSKANNEHMKSYGKYAPYVLMEVVCMDWQQVNLNY